MKLTTIYEDMVDSVELDLITEAIRFGPQQKKVLAEYERFFRLGLEYEFHINREHVDVPNDPEEFMDEARYDARREVIWGLAENFKPIAELLFDLEDHFDTARDFKDILDEAEAGDADMLRGLINFLISPSTIALLTEIVKNSTIREALEADFRVFTNLAKAYPSLNRDTKQAIGALRSIDVSPLEGMMSVATDNAIRIRAMELAEYVENTVNPDYVEGLIETRAEAEAQRLAGMQTVGYEEQYVDWAKSELENSPVWSLINDVTEDPSVVEGVEVISKPLSLRNTTLLMKYMFNFIKSNGYTSQKTGLHVNISMKNFGDIDPLRVMTLMDSDFFQNNSPSFKKENAIFKWDVRNDMIRANTDSLTYPVLEMMATRYINAGTKALEAELTDRLLMGKESKYRGINWNSFFRSYDPKDKRIEFRFFGGKGYENRFDDILNDISYLCYVILAVTKKAHTQDHLKGMIRILDRAAKRSGEPGITTFSDVLSRVRQY